MQRSDRGLSLSGRELDALVRGISGFELGRIPVQSFPPADRIVAGLGHLIRAHRDPRAWLVEAAFRMDLPPITIKGPLATMDGITRLVELELPMVLPTASDGLIFRYRGFGGTEFDDPEVTTLPGRHHLAAGEINAIFEADRAGENVWAAHLMLSATAWASLLDRHVAARVFVAADPPRVTVFGLSYVLQSDASLHNLRSPLESGPRPDRRDQPRAMTAAAGELPLRAPRAALVAWVDRRIAEGWLILRDFGAAGVVYDVCALSPDGRWAIGVHRVEGDWVRSPVLRLGPHSFAYARLVTDLHIARGDQIR